MKRKTEKESPANPHVGNPPVPNRAHTEMKASSQKKAPRRSSGVKAGKKKETAS